MLIETARFGDFELNESKLIEFPSGLPGFEELNSFIILEINETKPLYWLQSTQNKHISLPVIIPFELLDDYYIEIRENELEGLHIKDKNDLLILNVVVVPNELAEMTANLAAPIIVNLKEGLGKQLLIDAAELPVKYPIYDAIIKKLQGGAADVSAL